jgi:hypothetical protein
VLPGCGYEGIGVGVQRFGKADGIAYGLKRHGLQQFATIAQRKLHKTFSVVRDQVKGSPRNAEALPGRYYRRAPRHDVRGMSGLRISRTYV